MPVTGSGAAAISPAASVSTAAAPVKVESVAAAAATAAALPPEDSDLSEAIAPAPAAPPSEEGAPNAWPDEAAESAMLSELRDRGEGAISAPPGLASAAAAAATRDADEPPVDPKSLPPLADLVQRIPAEVRDTLEELFRAKFIRVTRVPKKALKS